MIDRDEQQPAQELPVIELHPFCVGCPHMEFQVKNRTLYNGKFPPALKKIACIHVEACKRMRTITVDKLIQELD